MDRNPENDPIERHSDRRTDSTYVQSSTDSGVTWFIVGALVIAAGVLAYLYFGGDEADTTAADSPAIEAPADTGRAATPEAPADSGAPPADGGAAAPAPTDSAPPAGGGSAPPAAPAP